MLFSYILFREMIRKIKDKLRFLEFYASPWGLALLVLEGIMQASREERQPTVHSS